MSKPSLDILTIAAQQAGWHTTMNTNFGRLDTWLEGGPLPIYELARTEDFPDAADWNRSIVFREAPSHANHPWELWFSDGVNWVPAAVPDVLNQWGPKDAFLPGSDPAVLEARNTHPVLTFPYDYGTAHAAYFSGFLPRRYRRKGLRVAVMWVIGPSPAYAESDDVVRWGVSFERHNEGAWDVDADSFSDETVFNSIAPSTLGKARYAVIDLSQGDAVDNLLPTDHFRLRLRRMTTSLADTLMDDVQVLGVSLLDAL